MDTSEKRFEYDIEQYLISHGYEQFNGQDKDGNWVHNRQHDVDKCIYMDVLCEFIAKTQPKEWAKYTKYYGDKAADKLYTRLEQTISNEGLISVLRNGITDMGVKLKVCYFKPESTLNETLNEQYSANILGCTRQFQYSANNGNTIDMVLSVNGIPVVAIELKNQFKAADVYKVVAAIDKLGYLEHVTFISFQLKNLVFLRRRYPEQPAQYLLDKWDEGSLDVLKKYNLGLDIRYTSLTKEIVDTTWGHIFTACYPVVATDGTGRSLVPFAWRWIWKIPMLSCATAINPRSG